MIRICSLDAAASSRQQNEILTEIDIWLGGIDLAVTGLDVLGDRVTVELTGLAEPPEAFDLATRLVPILGPDAEVTVRGLIGIVFLPISKVLTYRGTGTVSETKWSPKILGGARSNAAPPPPAAGEEPKKRRSLFGN